MNHESALRELGFSKEFLQSLRDFNKNVVELPEIRFEDDLVVGADLAAEVIIHDSQSTLTNDIVVTIRKERPQRRITSG